MDPQPRLFAASHASQSLTNILSFVQLDWIMFRSGDKNWQTSCTVTTTTTRLSTAMSALCVCVGACDMAQPWAYHYNTHWDVLCTCMMAVQTPNCVCHFVVSSSNSDSSVGTRLNSVSYILIMCTTRTCFFSFHSVYTRIRRDNELNIH